MCTTYSFLLCSLSTKTKTVSLFLPFPKCYIVGFIQFVAFSDWILSLSNIQLWSLHILLGLNSSFLFFLNDHWFLSISTFVYILPFEGYLGCIQLFMVIFNKADVSMCLLIPCGQSNLLFHVISSIWWHQCVNTVYSVTCIHYGI